MVSNGIGNFKKGKVKNLFLTLTPNTDDDMDDGTGSMDVGTNDDDVG